VNATGLIANSLPWTIIIILGIIFVVLVLALFLRKRLLQDPQQNPNADPLAPNNRPADNRVLSPVAQGPNERKEEAKRQSPKPDHHA